ncbi:MAG: sigma-70 family RNA polymerase sigma factor [Cytophagales bacterium]|nr:sigma-70 family RNA polymerase sigma factor [Bernardetiaceae bacterium]MDW8205478.1 sigma-70 family RNA polymerase sigma factor [Cytophagales bacterium]
MEVNNFTNSSNNEQEQEQDNERFFSTKALADFKLIDRAISGDEKAYAELMRRYKKPVYHTLLKMVRNPDDADDLTIEAFAKAFRNLPKFKKEYTFSTWLFRIATNNCIDFIRRKRLETTSINAGFSDENGDPVDIDIRDENLNPQENAINLQKIEIVRTMVTLLPDKYQQLVQLRYFEELSYEEIAQHLNAPLGTVKAQLHRARELLYDIARAKKDMI